MTKSANQTKDKILEAANALFYRDGVRATGVDAIAARAGITKRSLYYHFRSKDDLVEAYLISRDEPNLAAFRRWFGLPDCCLEDRIAGLFEGLKRATRHPDWRGCGFLRTAGELANMPGHPAVRAAARHKQAIESWLAGEFSAAGVAEADALARRMLLLIDGAFSAMLVHHDTDYIDAAAAAARDLCAMAQAKG
ncbi:TetR/AcrR family transcriptional regulator [Pacificispira sp.]|jgi:AcrR family transcriptional regulator|uniref:TetR/AcrR family transcriptional regulator n=1 Tax=Pacificispira sp. TaxID=2888761 RepID=UPI003B52B731